MEHSQNDIQIAGAVNQVSSVFFSPSKNSNSISSPVYVQGSYLVKAYGFNPAFIDMPFACTAVGTATTSLEVRRKQIRTSRQFSKSWHSKL